MHRYILISNKFEGYLTYSYDVRGYLAEFGNYSFMMPDDAKEYALRQLGNVLTLNSFLEWLAKDGRIVVKQSEDLSFERFWCEYDMARNKLDAQKLWKGLKDHEKEYIFYNLQAYKRWLKYATWYTQLYPDTYLRKHWRDEWDKVIEADKLQKANYIEKQKEKSNK